MRRYRSEANERWDGFEHRPGDIVISTRSKTGTTWLQMIVLLLIHGPDLPAPLAQLSPWLDWVIEPVADVRARLDAQPHRRVIKTHTPLDGLPLHPEVTYLVAGRHPLDVAESLHAHGRNIDRDRLAELSGLRTTSPEDDVDAWLATWIEPGVPATDALDTLPGLLHHIGDADEHRRAGRHDVVLLHYDDLTKDLDGGMRRLADHLGCRIDAATWPSLVEAATFESMLSRAAERAPDHLGVLADPARFFRAASTDRGVGRIGPAVAAQVDEIVRRDLDADLAAWLLSER